MAFGLSVKVSTLWSVEIDPLTLIVEVIKAVGVQEHAVWVIHKTLGRREMNLRSQRAGVVSSNWHACWYSSLDVSRGTNNGDAGEHSQRRQRVQHDEKGYGAKVQREETVGMRKTALSTALRSFSVPRASLLLAATQTSCVHLRHNRDA